MDKKQAPSFVDRFVIQDDLIVQQDVWNDLAESGVLTRTEVSAAPNEDRSPS